MDIIYDLLIIPKFIFDILYNIFTNQFFLILITIILVLYIFVFIGLGKSTSQSTKPDNNFIEMNQSSSYSKSTSTSTNTTIMNFLFIIILIIFFILFISFLYHKNLLNIFNFTTFTEIINPLSNNPQINIDLETNHKPLFNPPQVFNIPGNYYKYDEAQTLCKAYGSRLANYKELEHAYNKGAEWCNYGWSDGQMALFPTQAETYKNLQTIPGHEHDCGRPGINGGYIANPNVRFGVNCFGNKPRMTAEEEELMATTTPYPLTKQDIEMEEQVDFWKKRLPQILVSPFNYNNWSKV